MSTKKLSWLAAATLGMAVFYRSQNLRKLASKSDALTAQAVADLNSAYPSINAACHFIEVGDTVLHTLVAGPEAGPLAVLLHGFPEHWLSWRKQIPVLAQAGYRVVVPDQRGYNRSDKPRGIRPYRLDALTGDVANLIHKFDREKAVIVGHDWGGAVAWQFAVDYPQMTEKLVVMNAPHPKALRRELKTGWDQRLKSWYILFFQLPLLPEFFFTLNPRQTARQAFVETAVQPEAFSAEEVEMMAVALSQPRAITCMINWYRALRYPPAKKYTSIEVPTLLIWGEQDFALGKPLTYSLTKWVPNLRLQYVPYSGHWVQNEASDEVNRALLTFMQNS